MEQSPSRKRSTVSATSREKSREKSPRTKSHREKFPSDKSPRAKTSKEKSPRSSKERKSQSPESPKESRIKDQSPKPRRKSRDEKSPKKSVVTLDEPSRKKSDSEKSSSFNQDQVTSPAKKQPSKNDSQDETSVVANVNKSPSNIVQLKSYVRVVTKEPAPLVPYDDDVMSISPRDSTDGLNFPFEKEMPTLPEAEQQKVHKSKESKHKGSDEGESGKKIKVKKKSKKSQEKKRKKKSLGKDQSLENVEKNTDDELDDLLFTKTEKESKEEDVFNDSEVFSAKHNLRTAVVDLDRKKLRTIASPVRKDGKRSPPKKKEPLKSKKPKPTSPVRKEPVERETLPSVIVDPEISPVPYEPEVLSEISEDEFVESENPPEVGAVDDSSPQPEVSAIPFLSVVEEPGITDEVELSEQDDNIQQTDDDYNVEQPFESGNVPYSPLGDEPYSPAEEQVSDFGSPKKSSTMNLSDISTKDTVVENAVGIITSTEKVEDFLGRIEPPGQDYEVADMDMSPANGLTLNSDNDDDIIEQLHKEFVRTQHQVDVQPGNYVDNHVPPSLSPLHTAASDPIVQAYGSNTNFNAVIKPKRPKRSKHKKEKNVKEVNKPLAREKKDIEVKKSLEWFLSP